MRARGVTAGATKGFLRDAFEQLDEVLRRTSSDSERGRVGASPQEVRAARQQIQRWLVVFAREHLVDICEKLMSAAAEYEAAEPKAAADAHSILPHKADGPATTAQQRDDSVTFFLLETLRRVLTAAAERGSLMTLPSRDGALLPFCFDHLSLAKPVAIRHVAFIEFVDNEMRRSLEAQYELLDDMQSLKDLPDDDYDYDADGDLLMRPRSSAGGGDLLMRPRSSAGG